MRMIPRFAALALLAVGAAACGPRIKPLHPVMANGEVLESPSEQMVATARVEGEMERARHPAPATAAEPTSPVARADALLREGDDYVMANRLDLALARYDQADILRPGHPETTLRIATTLDKQLRPVEALIRYRLFLHQLELEKIEAQGDAAAKLAEAIALAQQRIIVLEKSR